ncbi:MAG: hypothetical protein ACM31M_03970 [Nitrososphaerota archaeon]
MTIPNALRAIQLNANDTTLSLMGFPDGIDLRNWNYYEQLINLVSFTD